MDTQVITLTDCCQLTGAIGQQLHLSATCLKYHGYTHKQIVKPLFGFFMLSILLLLYFVN